MQQAAWFVADDGHVVVLLAGDGEPRQHGVALVAFGEHGIATVSVVSPQRVGQVLVLRLRGPSVMATGVPGVLAKHLLQQHDVGPHAADRVAQRGQDESAPPDVQAHVDVEAEHAELCHRHVLRSAAPERPAILARDG